MLASFWEWTARPTGMTHDRTRTNSCARRCYLWRDRNRATATVGYGPNQEWALDFVSDALASGRALRTLTIVDSYTRECPAIEVGTGICSEQVTRVLERIIAEHGKPESVRCDNGPEFTSRHFLAWCEEQGIAVIHIQPGKPMQNGHVESFNGRFRDECL